MGSLAYCKLLAVCAVTILFLGFALQNGLLSGGGSAEPNKCTMTYMHPSYVQIPMIGESRLGSKYELHAYFDGSSKRAFVCPFFSSHNMPI
jgi:hypothetical protein